jgi:dihydroxyacid dehydratase/phosphogluconate dehydratase
MTKRRSRTIAVTMALGGSTNAGCTCSGAHEAGVEPELDD